MNTELEKLTNLMKDILLNHGSEMTPEFRRKMCAFGIEVENSMKRTIEIDIWADNKGISRFRTEFASMNECEFLGSEIVKSLGVDKRIALKYKVHSPKELEFPEQGYYQLNNVFR